MNAVRTEQLTRRFGKMTAVDRLDIEIEPGTVFGFLGPNGAGKTTTIRLLLGLLEPTEGKAEVLGFDTADRSADIRLVSGALLEHSGLYDRLSAEDNLEFYGRVWRMSRRARQDRIRELLNHLQLWDRRGEMVRAWSRGMKQKLAVARALLHRPTLVFLDEPTAGLDPVAAATLREDLSGLVEREGLTVFLTTHNLSEAEKLCNKVGVINRGKLLALGHPDELRARSGSHVEIVGRNFSDEAVARLEERSEVLSIEIRNHRLAVELDGEADTAPLVSLLVHAGVEIEEVRKGEASLEEAFFSLVREDAQ
jgi:ABC-2 type transport system ATP-binding protein